MTLSRSGYALAAGICACAISLTSLAQAQDPNVWRPSPEGLRSMPDYFPFETVESGNAVYELPRGDAIPSDNGLDLDAYNRENGSTGMIVLHRGRIVYENYFQGADETSHFSSFSMVKSITGTLIGIAEGEGHIDSIEDPIVRYVPGLAGTAWRDVTIEQALQMSSGVRYDENVGLVRLSCLALPPGPVFADCDAVRDEFGDTQGLLLSLDERAAPPGTAFNYSTAESQVLGWVLQEATGRSPAEYLSEKIWQPLGMEDDAEWLLDSSGLTLTGMSLNARLRDYARFGLLMLNDGVIDGRRILPEGWVARATTPGKPYLERLDPEVLGYQYQWWIVPDGLAVLPGGSGFAAQGSQGQFLHIDPGHELVVAMTSAWPAAVGWDVTKAIAFHATVTSIVEALGYE